MHHGPSSITCVSLPVATAVQVKLLRWYCTDYWPSKAKGWMTQAQHTPRVRSAAHLRDFVIVL
jgi:hypothetical protein